MFSRMLLALAAMAGASFASAPAAAQDFLQSYTITTVVDLEHIVTYNQYALGGGGTTNSFKVAAPGGVITDAFPKSALNPPLLTYFLGVTTDLSAIDHLVVAFNSAYASTLLGAGDDFGVTFASFDESSLIAALQLLDTPDLSTGDPGYATQIAAKDAASALLFSFSDRVGLQGGLVDASGGAFTLLSFSTPSSVGAGTASLSAVPEPTTWIMMFGGFGAVGFALRRRPRLAPAIAT